MRQYRWGILGLIVGVISLAIYYGFLSGTDPAGVETMGKDDSGLTLKDWLTFGGMVLGFGTALVNLIKSVIDMRVSRQGG